MNRGPLNHLLTRQKTSPFVSSASGRQLVMTTGSYPYTVFNVLSQFVLWKTDAPSWLLTRASQRASRSGSIS